MNRLVDALSEMARGLGERSPWWLLLVFAVLVVLGVVAAVILRRRRRAPRAAFIDGVRSWHQHRRRPSEISLRRVLEADPDDFEAALMLGHLLRRRGMYQRALLLHRQLLMRPHLPTAKRANVLAACIADALAGGQAAQELDGWIDELLEVDPRHAFGLQARVESLRQQDDLRAALRAFRTAEEVYWSGLDVSPEVSADLRSRREALFLCREGDDLVVRERFKDAARVYHAAARRAEQHPAPQLGLARLAAAQKKFPQVVLHLRRAAMLGATGLALEALSALEDPRADQAVAEVARHVLKDDPQNRTARRAWIRVAMRDERLGQPGTLIDEALAAGDHSAWMVRMRALLSLRHGDTAEAIEVLESGPDPSLIWQCTSCLTIERRHGWRCGRCGAWESLELVESPAETGSREGADLEAVRATAGR